MQNKPSGMFRAEPLQTNKERDEQSYAEGVEAGMAAMRGVVAELEAKLKAKLKAGAGVDASDYVPAETVARYQSMARAKLARLNLDLIETREAWNRDIAKYEELRERFAVVCKERDEIRREHDIVQINAAKFRDLYYLSEAHNRELGLLTGQSEARVAVFGDIAEELRCIAEKRGEKQNLLWIYRGDYVSIAEYVSTLERSLRIAREENSNSESWVGVLHEEYLEAVSDIHARNWLAARAELIQVCAVAIQMAEACEDEMKK